MGRRGILGDMSAAAIRNLYVKLDSPVLLLGAYKTYAAAVTGKIVYLDKSRESLVTKRCSAAASDWS